MRRAVSVGAAVAAMAGLASCSHPSATAHSAPPTATGVPLHAPAPAVVASGLHFPVNLTFDSRGGLWFTSSILSAQNPTNGVWYIPPGGRPRRVVTGLAAAGLVWDGNSLYVASVTTGTGEITVLEGFNGTRFTSQRVRLSGLPVGEDHPIGSIARGPDGRLYIGVGSVTDPSLPPGTVVSFAPDGNPVVRATG